MCSLRSKSFRLVSEENKTVERLVPRSLLINHTETLAKQATDVMQNDLPGQLGRQQLPG